MAAEKKAATPTEYLVLRQISDSNPSVDPKARTAWQTVNVTRSSSAVAAIRAVVSKLDEKAQAGTFVAVPARSWRPTKVAPKTTVQLELTEVKP